MRSVVFYIMLSVVITLSGCEKKQAPMASVRFRNIMTDNYVFPYGLMFGDAVYGGSLGNNEVTPYFETRSSAYPILARRVDGQWIEISEGKFYVLPALKYTILIFGTVESFAFQLNED